MRSFLRCREISCLATESVYVGTKEPMSDLENLQLLLWSGRSMLADVWLDGLCMLVAAAKKFAMVLSALPDEDGLLHRVLAVWHYWTITCHPMGL